MRSQHTKKLLSAALAVLFSIGTTDCVEAQNPFAGKLPSLPLPKILRGKRQTPIVKPLANKLPTLPRPNFGNLARTIRTPAAEAIASRSSQPLATPAKIFDTSLADEQLAAAKMPRDVKSSLERARKAAEASRDAINTEQSAFNSAVANTKASSSDDLFSKIKTKPKATTAKLASKSSNSGGLWGDYESKTNADGSAKASGDIEALAKVNPRLYDRYGKLTTTEGGTDSQFVAKTTKKNFDFQPDDMPNTQLAKKYGSAIDKVSSDNSEATIASLRSQLMELRSRGAGTSDQLKIPHRSAFDIAGVAPVEPVAKEPELPIHRGFGDAAALGDGQPTVVVPDPTAPPNILRATAPPTPGMVATLEIKGQSNDVAANTPAEDLPVGNTLSAKLKSSNGLASQSESMVNNDFVGLQNVDADIDVDQDSIPMLRGTAKEKVPSMELPRQLSQASLDALEAAKQEKLNQPLPEVNKKSAPLVGGFANPKIAANQLQSSATQAPQTFQQPSTAFPGHFHSRPTGRQQQVTTNQFFNRAAVDAPKKTEPESTTRVAEAQLLPPSLPEGLTTGDSTYSPGSVRSLEKKLW